MAQLHLKIVTPEKLIFDDDVLQVNVPTDKGEIGVLPNHISLMAKVVPGELRIKKEKGQEILATGLGFLQIAGNTLTIMTDMAVDENDIDEKVVEEAKKRAEAALDQKLSSEEYAETIANLQKSLAQLKVKRRVRSH